MDSKILTLQNFLAHRTISKDKSDDPLLKGIFNKLTTPNIVHDMIQNIRLNVPPLLAVYQEINLLYDIKNVSISERKQWNVTVGKMISFILEQFNYISSGSRDVSSKTNGTFTKASLYRYVKIGEVYLWNEQNIPIKTAEKPNCILKATYEIIDN